MKTWIIFLSMFAVLYPPTRAVSQETSARLSLEDIINRHRNDVPCRPLATSIAERGIKFEATPDVINRLKQEQVCDLVITEVQRRSVEWVRINKLEQGLKNAQIREYISQGKSHLDRGEYAQAISEFEKARALNPGNNEVLSVRETALRAQKSEASLTPGQLSLDAIQRLLTGKVTPKRVANLVKQRKISFDRNTWSDEREKILRGAGADDEVIVAIKSIFPQDQPTPPPEEAVVLVNRGKAIARQKIPNYEEALKLFEQALKISEGYGEAWALKGDALRGLKRFQDAIDSYDRALTFNKRDAATWSTKAIAHKELAQHNEAVQSFDRLLELSPLNVGAWIRRGDSLVELKRCEEARKSYDRALNIDPTYHLTLEEHYDRLKTCGA